MKVRNRLKSGNGPIFLALLATIVVVFLIELIFVRDFNIAKVAFINRGTSAMS